MNLGKYLIPFCFFAFQTRGAPIPFEIPGVPTKFFRDEALYEGGGQKGRVILSGFRLGNHSDLGFERWVFDFSPVTRGSLSLPLIQIRLIPQKPDRDGRIYLILSTIDHHSIGKALLSQLVKKSKLVTDIFFYPILPDGDMGIEFVFQKKILLSPHYSKEAFGRLILDLKESPLAKWE